MIRAQNENTYQERSMAEIDQILSDVYDDDILNSKMVRPFRRDTKYSIQLIKEQDKILFWLVGLLAWDFG